MKPERLPSWDVLAEAMRIVNDKVPLELIVLKMHLLTETLLYRLLGVRLEVAEEHLPTLQFFALAKLALGGETFKMTLVKVLALNDLRNEYAHELDGQRMPGAFEKFCAKTAMFWPPFDIKAKPAEFAAIRDSAVCTGALITMNEVSDQVTRLLIAQLASKGQDTATLHQLAANSEKLAREITAEQNSIRALFAK